MKWGAHLGIFSTQPNLFISAGDQSNMCTFSWHTTARAEAGLFMSYKVLNVCGEGNSVWQLLTILDFSYVL